MRTSYQTGCVLCGQNCGFELEVTEMAHKGHVVIPHGFGLVYDGKKYGANVNRLTKNTHRDQ
jgi:hypothetical protein